jgi:hypothetical protein
MKIIKPITTLAFVLGAIFTFGCHTAPDVSLPSKNISASISFGSNINGKAFDSSLDWKDLQATPKWLPDRSKPPVSLTSARRAATKMLAKAVSNIEQWKLVEVSFKQPFGSETPAFEGFWIYEFRFDGPKYSFNGNNNMFSSANVIVLMNGKAIPLKPVGSR